MAIATGAAGPDVSVAAINFNRTNLRKTRAALEKSRLGSTVFTLAALGDSTQAGVGIVGNVQTGQLSELVLTELARAGFAKNGTGFVGGYKASGDDTRISKASWSALSGSGPLILNATGAALTFTSDVAGTAIRVFYGNTGGAFTVAVDGGAATPVTPSGAQTMGTYQVTGLSNAVHTVVVARTAGSAQIFGFECYTPGGGMRAANMAIGGFKASDSQVGTWFAAAELTDDFGAQTVLVGEGYNDCAVGGYSDAKLAFALGALDGQIAKGIEPIVCLVNPSTLFTADVLAWNSAMLAASLSRSLPVVAPANIWSTQSQGNTDGYYSDDVHLLIAGYQSLARVIASGILEL